MAIRDTARHKLTYEDYLLFPDDGNRHEILDGEHYVSPAPKTKHQRISMAFSIRLGGFVEAYRRGHLFAAPLDVLLSKHDVAQPDLVFISNERAAILTEDNVQGAPDLVIEILSASTRWRDENLKLQRYQELGIQEYWIVDPFLERVNVFRRNGGRLELAEELSAQAGDVLTTLLIGLRLPLAEIFA
ncbi:MAG TPA: Uma2 family endonuclease [Thermoanaerobaculia bacterium]